MNESILPEGRYKAIVHDWSTGLSSAKGTPYVKFGFKILEGEYAGRIVDWYGYFTEKTVGRLVTDFLAVGYEGDDPLAHFGRAKSVDQVPGKLRVVQLVIAHEEWNGRVQVRVKYINEMAEAKPVDEAARVSVRNAFAAAKAAKASKGRARAPEPEPIDDTPF